jgi:S1-C subfamily serine protease
MEWSSRRVRAALAAALALAGLSACDALEARRRGLVASQRPIPSDLLEDERNTIGVFRRTSKSVVFVGRSERRRNAFSLNATEDPRGTGSGFIWDRDGHIVTNFHVIEGGNRFSVTLWDGSIHEARLIGTAPRKDLAVLVIDPAGLDLSPLTLGDSNALVVGQKVLAIGNPFGLDGSLSTGVISALGREIRSAAETVIEDVIQTDASINPGDSGGPLLDSRGRLIGVTTAIFSTSGSSAGVGFAVPVATLARVMPQLIEHGRVKWPGLGVTLLPDHLAARWGMQGVIVREVLADSPADRAGLKSIQTGRRGNVVAFDLITEVANRQVRQGVDLLDALDDYDAGDVVKVRFVRGGDTWEANIELAVLD